MKQILTALCWLLVLGTLAHAQGMPGFRAGPGENASLTRRNQAVQGGATSDAICALDHSIPPNAAGCSPGSGSTLTINCGLGPIQAFTNGAAFTLAAPVTDGSCAVLMTNNASAGAVTPSGWTNGSNVGAALTTTNTNKFTFFIWRANGVSGYSIFAHQ